MLGAQKKKEVEKRVADQQTGYDDALEENGTHAQIRALKRDISQDNVDELKALVLYRHEKALRLTFKTTRSEALHYNMAPLMIMALIDRDHNNNAGIVWVLPEVAALNDNIKDVEAAKQDLEDIHNLLIEERKIHGLNPVCL